MNIRLPQVFQDSVNSLAKRNSFRKSLTWPALARQVNEAIAAEGLELPQDRAEKNAFVRDWLKRNRSRIRLSMVSGLMVLPLVGHAQEGMLNLADVEGVRNVEILESGDVRITMQDGTVLRLDAASVQLGEAGSVLIGPDMAAQIAAAAEAATAAGVAGVGGAIAGAGVPGAIAAVAGGVVAAAAAAGGGGGSSSSSGPAVVSKSVFVLDGPLENALVFYDANGNGIPEMAEFLGLTDENGAAQVEYTPTANGSFIVISAPVSADRAEGFGWTDAFIDGDNIADTNLGEVVTRDVVTANRFQISLSGNDTGADDQIISPISTLIAQGADEGALKAALGLPADLDLANFNYIDNFASEDPDVQEAARTLASVNIAMARSIEAAVTAAQAGSEQPLSLAQIRQISQDAARDAAEVISSLPANTPLEDIAAISSAVISARQSNADITANDMIGRINTARDAGESTADAISEALQVEVDEGRLSNEQSAAVRDTSTAVSTGARDIETLLRNADGPLLGEGSED